MFNQGTVLESEILYGGIILTITIDASVGLNGANRPADVEKIHQLLNSIPRHLGGTPRPELPASGNYSVNTLVAIKRFQWRLFPQRQRPVDGLVEPRGSTLREMNRLAQGQAPIRPRPTGTRGQNIPLYLTEVWQLIRQNHTTNLDVYPNELLVGLFWEESNFINTRGRVRPDMIGFGQVWEGNFSALNSRYRRSFTPAGVLANNSQSVEIASLCLDNARRDGQPATAPPRARRDALGYYATGTAGGWNHVIDGWLRCMQMLQDNYVSRYMGGGAPIADLVGVTIRQALWEGRPGPLSVWSPDMALPPDM